MTWWLSTSSSIRTRMTRFICTFKMARESKNKNSGKSLQRILYLSLIKESLSRWCLVAKINLQQLISFFYRNLIQKQDNVKVNIEKQQSAIKQVISKWVQRQSDNNELHTEVSCKKKLEALFLWKLKSFHWW